MLRLPQIDMRLRHVSNYEADYMLYLCHRIRVYLYLCCQSEKKISTEMSTKQFHKYNERIHNIVK